MKISYLIAVRNKVSTIRHCLSSLMREGVDQVIVVDGYSTDGTSKVIDSFPVTHLYDEGKGNIPAARNWGLNMCTGEYVAVIDGDQWISAGFDRKLKRVLAAERYDAIICREIRVGSSVWAKAQQEERTESWVNRPSWVWVPRVYRLSFLLKVGGWNEKMLSFEDHDLWMRVRKLRPKFLRSSLILHHDASDLSILSEFTRGRQQSSTLIEYVRRYPSQWQKLLNIAPIGWIIDYIIALTVVRQTANLKNGLCVLILRAARSIGWLVGLFLPGRDRRSRR